MSMLATRFAPAERASMDDVRRQWIALDRSKTTRLVDAVPQIIMVLNRHRQIVYCNKTLLDALKQDKVDTVLGKRPGEALGCIHAGVMEGGCGTSEFCSQCGAVKAIMSGLMGKRDIQECRLLRDDKGRVEALDLSVCATPFDLDGERFTVFTVTDVSHQKRRRILERTFFHDILNRAGGLRGLLGLLAEDAPEPIRDDLNLLHSQFKYMVEEIINHKDIMAAENNELTPRLIHLDGGDVVKVVAATYASHEAALGRRIAVETGQGDLTLHTDYNLLCRVLGNMLKNALEATRPGDVVTVFCRPDERPQGDGQGAEALLFGVHNPGVMPREVQLQVFKRSFSTKGSDRGLGTFSMKLFTERYLGGQVFFSSREDEGTLFIARLPRTPPHEDLGRTRRSVRREVV